MGWQGFPAQTIHGGMSRVTTARAPMTVPLPIVTPGPMNAPAATQHSLPMTIGENFSGKCGWV